MSTKKMNNEERLLPIILKFKDKINNNDFVADKTGVKCVEIIAAQIELDPTQPLLDFSVKKTNEKYCLKELNWYLSQSLSIKNYVDDIQIWNSVCTKDDKKEVNSNYGYLVFSDKNYNQYQNCLQELMLNQESRRSIMIYTRPSIQEEYNRSGMSDFICCNFNQFFIRNNELISIVSFRSQDFVFGFFNDFYWECYIYNSLYEDLLTKYTNLKKGQIVWISNSLHVYERHFNMIKDMV